MEASSSSGLGHQVLILEITGSNPVEAANVVSQKEHFVDTVRYFAIIKL